LYSSHHTAAYKVWYVTTDKKVSFHSTVLAIIHIDLINTQVKAKVFQTTASGETLQLEPLFLHFISQPSEKKFGTGWS
jgi:hypothetical protein